MFSCTQSYFDKLGHSINGDDQIHCINVSSSQDVLISLSFDDGALLVLLVVDVYVNTKQI